MNLIIDIDGTIADLATPWLDLYNLDYDDNLRPQDLTRWNTHEFVKPECGLKIYDYLWLEDLYLHVQPIHGALDIIVALRSEGHRVTYLTSGLAPGKIRWLYDNGFMQTGSIGWQSSPEFIIAHDKSLVKGDLIVDDKPENVLQFEQGILFSQPWNASAEGFTRAWDWLDVYEIVQRSK